MKLTFARLALSVVALTAGIVPMAAETHGILRVSVPFAFMANGTNMPAGDYAVEQNGDNGTMIIHNLSGKKSIMVLTGPMGLTPAGHKPSLTFSRKDGVSVLTSITTPLTTVRSLSGK